MKDIDSLNLVCLTEGELTQWQARGHLHLASSRVVPAGKVKNASLFALAPCSRIDDAKARIIVQLKSTWRDQSILHPLFLDPAVLSLNWDLIDAIGPTLNQFIRRLDVFDLPLAEWDVSSVWDDWLISQGCYERLQVISQELRRLGFISFEILNDESLIAEVISKVMRPKIEVGSFQKLSVGWRILFENRDQILKKLRFEGHSDRLSFLQASLQEILQLNSINVLTDEIHLSTIERDSGWVFKDLNPDVLSVILNTSGPEPLSMEKSISPLIGAIYLRLFDELHYGAQDWSICFNLLRYAKYSMDSIQADLLFVSILGSFSAEEIKRLNLVEKFRFN